MTFPDVMGDTYEAELDLAFEPVPVVVSAIKPVPVREVAEPVMVPVREAEPVMAPVREVVQVVFDDEAEEAEEWSCRICC